jgi:hypothetical protein
MMKIDIEIPSEKMLTKFGSLIATGAFKYLVFSHMGNCNKPSEMKLVTKQYVDMLVIAQHVDEFITQYSHRSKSDVSKKQKVIQKLVNNLDSFARNYIPSLHPLL